ncbi:ATP-dependent helicase HrpB [Candidatus Latescibacterota bacterium]
MLPIYDIADELVGHLRAGNRLVLSAPTGSGKTTQVPQILHRQGFLPGSILVLQPRRLATRLVATRVAAEMGCAPGELVGYQTRHERRVGNHTRIRFLTEGLFLRQLLSDPQLTGVGAVLLDEFHERSLGADLSLGFIRGLQEGTRPDLRLVVMSATLDADAVAAQLGCPALVAQGRAFPVDIHYDSRPGDSPIWERAATAAADLVATFDEGHVLVFMPGAYEIRRTVEACQRRLAGNSPPVEVLPLYGALSPAQQDAAVGPTSGRKVIVATNVAETSITIDGVGHVVDSGLARVLRFDPGRGLNALLVENISQASADQRTGRAGRQRPGTCRRLWPGSERYARPQRDTPEVQRLDLSEALLQLKVAGLDDPSDFPWLDQPDPTALAGAADLLAGLGAVDGGGALTDIGRAMATFPAHPRLSRLLVEAHRSGVVERAAVWAALVAERDILRRPTPATYTDPPADDIPSDLTVRERAFDRARRVRFDPRRCDQLGLDHRACREVDRAAAQFLRLAAGDTRQRRPRRAAGKADGTDALVRSLLVAYYDHVARRRPGGLTCEMPGRRRVVLDRDSVARESEYVIAVEARETEAPRADGGGVRTVLSLATAVEADALEETLPDRVELSEDIVWNDRTRAVERVEVHAYGGLTLFRQTSGDVDPAVAADLLVEGIRTGQLILEGWSDRVQEWMTRARCVAEWFPERGLVTYDDEDLGVIWHEIVAGATRYSQIRQRPCLDAVRHALSWTDQQFVDEMAPLRVQLPGGFRLPVTYRVGEPPRGRARIQDLYDLHRTPTVAGGRQKILLEILAPNFRPAQVTDDLAGFWTNTYPELKKELKRRYPKHEWR